MGDVHSFLLIFVKFKSQILTGMTSEKHCNYIAKAQIVPTLFEKNVFINCHN